MKTLVYVGVILAILGGSALAADVECGPREQPTSLPASYTVKAGDDLHLISTMFFDNARKWKVIWNANRKLIPNPNVLKPGVVLTIPQG